MSEIKTLYSVLPEEKRVVNTVKIGDILSKPLVIHSATFTRAGDVDYATALVSVEGSTARANVTCNQLQIVNALKYVDEKKAFPVAAMFAPYGKSYSLVDPVYPESEPAPAASKEG